MTQQPIKSKEDAAIDYVTKLRISSASIDKRRDITANNAFKAGWESYADQQRGCGRWVSVEDKSRKMLPEEDYLILFDSGEIRRYAEEDLPAEIITHWMPLPPLPDESPCEVGEENRRLREGRPKIVCLCGSTKFKDEFIEANKRETLVGNIVLTVGMFGHIEGLDMQGDVKTNLDELHKRKIDLADEIFVIDVGGYIGSSTRSEIDYAIAHNKPVRYLSALSSVSDAGNKEE